MSILEDKERLKEIFSSLTAECVLIITGQSGAGKEVLLHGLHRIAPVEFPLSVIQTGEEFRNNMEKFSPVIRQQMQETNDRGQRQDGRIAAVLVKAKLLFELSKNSGPTIIEGSPRSIIEAEQLYDFIWNVLHRRIILVDLYAPDWLATERILHRNEEDRKANRPIRTDTDTPEKIETKIKFYHSDVTPAVQRMREYSKWHVIVLRVAVIRGMTPDHVLEEVLTRLPLNVKMP